ncbi:NAD(P)-binding protein [Aspergillus heteromorphus CBS 117.55]|uniref:NAD(P)-binding protein n=1 Tax=Aspergillus heteromorphus CBS 117.55 TaxID=1448321 RepID=A0A317WVV9_9EURO|nr:NAD(P)-binding protein [Aspergillus heteromorphus CBS 117.55]PWY88420.1 NAD(P)-binding protein [Aspergillus heteromorphus CBS 117.55]
MSPQKKVLVTCATGNQGRGVVQHCLAADHQVFAYVRDPTTPAATQLAQWGATLVPGDLDDLEALRTAMDGMNSVFLTEVQTGDCTADLQRSKNVILAAQEAAAAAATVSHVILSTAIKTGQHASFPGWETPASDSDDDHARAHPMRQYWLNKHALETRVRAAAAAASASASASSSDGFIRHWTIVRPGHYLQNLLPPVNALTFPEFQQDRVLNVAWKPDTKLPWVDAGDVGIVVAAAVADPDRYSHRTVDLAVEALTVEQLAEKIGRVLHESKVQVRYRSEEEVDEMIRLGSPVAAAHRWANQVPGEDAVGNCQDDLGELAQHLTSVDTFLTAHASRL